MNGDLLTEFDGPNGTVMSGDNINDFTSSFINNLHSNFPQLHDGQNSMSPISSLSSDHDFQKNLYDDDVNMMDVGMADDAYTPIDIFDKNQEQALSSSSSDSGLSSDHLDL